MPILTITVTVVYRTPTDQMHNEVVEVVVVAGAVVDEEAVPIVVEGGEMKTIVVHEMMNGRS